MTAEIHRRALRGIATLFVETVGATGGSIGATSVIASTTQGDLVRPAGKAAVRRLGALVVGPIDPSSLADRLSRCLTFSPSDFYLLALFL